MNVGDFALNPGGSSVCVPVVVVSMFLGRYYVLFVRALFGKVLW